MKQRRKRIAISGNRDSDPQKVNKGGFRPLISINYWLFAHCSGSALLGLVGFHRILVSGVGLENFLNDISADSSGIMAGDVAVITLLEVDAQLAGNLILHVVKSSSASAVACH